VTKVGIINVTGYAGVELARLLHTHKGVDLVAVTGRGAVGQKLGEYFPHLCDMDFTITADIEASVDFVFSALPQVASAEACLPYVQAAVKVVDISADFRLKDAAVYKEWYGADHPAPEMLEGAVYGLTELYRPQLASATLVANPGCYPTAVLLALAPAVKEGLITADIIADCKSGVSGAGRGLGLIYHYAEENENLLAYSVSGHRHLPEVEQELRAMAPPFEPRVTLMMHLVPLTRGIFASCYAPLVEGKLPAGAAGREAVMALYRDFYKGEPFVRVAPQPPATKHTWGNNYCIVYPTVDVRTNRLVVFSVLDNLVKGAAGQAIQNMNLMVGLPETMGLEALPVYP